MDHYLSNKEPVRFPLVRFESLIELRKIIKQDNFSTLTYNVVIGNQVIVRGDTFELVHSIIALLTVRKTNENTNKL